MERQQLCGSGRVLLDAVTATEERQSMATDKRIGMVQTNVGQKLVKRNILRVFYGDRFRFCDSTFS